MKDKLKHQEKNKFTPFDIWEKGGLTEHMGGIYATRRLLAKCSLNEGMKALNVGCGTGYTACTLAKNYETQVVALDINQRGIIEAGKRVLKQGVNEKVLLIQADAHCLPFKYAVFDLVIIESVLVFCDAEKALSEIYKALKPGSIIGFNELTFLKPPPARLISLLAGTLGIYAFQQKEWESALKRTGFVDITSETHKVNLWHQLASHLQVDGLSKYLTSIVVGVTDKTISKMFFRKEMLTAAFDFLPYVGYGIYIGKKP